MRVLHSTTTCTGPEQVFVVSRRRTGGAEWRDEQYQTTYAWGR